MKYLALELTGFCQLSCTHCYAESSPTGGHGLMAEEDWCRVISEAADHGVDMIQLIGGEPTTHPGFVRLVEYALFRGLRVEAFTNLLSVTPIHWRLYARPGVSLATSYYSDLPAEHDAITGRIGSHTRTRANIAEAVRRGIPIRAGIIDVRSREQQVTGARADLLTLGVQDISVDRVRKVGRGLSAEPHGTVALCGGCGQGAVSSRGQVWPCVFARDTVVGDVHHDGLADILDGPLMRSVVIGLAARRGVPTVTRCTPDTMDKCNPRRGDA